MRITIWIFLLMLLLILGVLYGLVQGNARLLLSGWYADNLPESEWRIIMGLRLPRLVLAALCGGALAVSGWMLQILLSNPLAEPYILGGASGAALGASLALLGWLPIMFGGFYMPILYGFVGALVAMGMALLVSMRAGKLDTIMLLVSGVLISSVLNSVLSLLTYLSAQEAKARIILFWMLGSFERANMDQLGFPALVLVVAVVVSFLLRRHLLLIVQGQSRSSALGLPQTGLRVLLLGLAALLTASVVSLCGVIGFVGLTVPHLAGRLCGSFHHRTIGLVCALLGGCFMVWSDILGRAIYPPAGLPVGIIACFAAIPFLFLLLLRKRKQHEF